MSESTSWLHRDVEGNLLLPLSNNMHRMASSAADAAELASIEAAWTALGLTPYPALGAYQADTGALYYWDAVIGDWHQIGGSNVFGSGTATHVTGWVDANTIGDTGWIWEPIGGNMWLPSNGGLRSAASSYGPGMTFFDNAELLIYNFADGAPNDGTLDLHVSLYGYLQLDCDSATQFYVNVSNSAQDAWWVEDSLGTEYAWFTVTPNGTKELGLNLLNDAGLYISGTSADMAFWPVDGGADGEEPGLHLTGGSDLYLDQATQYFLDSGGNTIGHVYGSTTIGGLNSGIESRATSWFSYLSDDYSSVAPMIYLLWDGYSVIMSGNTSGMKVEAGNTSNYLAAANDGKNYSEGVLNLNNHKVEALAAATTAGDAPRYEQTMYVGITASIGAVGNGTPSTGKKISLIMPWAGTVTAWRIHGDVSGSAVVDLYRSGASIIGAGGNKPTLSTAQDANAAVSGWTSTALAANDVLDIYLNSVTTIEQVTVIFNVTKT